MFKCEQCGCCCRNIGKAPWAVHMALPSGACKYLNQENNLCSIYKDRPLYCNVDAYYTKYLSKEMTREEFYAVNKKECKRLQSLMNYK